MGPTTPHSSGRSAAPSLRPYQIEGLAAIARELATHRSTLLVAATGTGKTVSLAELTRREVSRSGRVLILVHRDELVRQTRRKLEAVGLWPDVEKGSERANTLAKVVIASVQTLRGARLKRWARERFSLVIVDEAHHATATTYRAVLDHFDAAKVVGVTATPDRADGAALGEIFESVASRYEIRQAIADEFLVPVVARRVVIDSVDLSTVASRAGDLAQDQLSAIMDTERALRGVAVPLLELARDRRTIAFCVDVKHAMDLAAMLNTLRPGSARAVSGETGDEERRSLLEGHERGAFQFLCNCDVLVEGYDSPIVSCVAMVRPTKSRGRYVQCAGRGLRPCDGKRDCLILDFSGTAGKHRLVGPVDCLVGSGEQPIDDDVHDEIARILGSAQLPLEVVQRQAEDEIAKRRVALQVSAVVRYRAEVIDPFVGEIDEAAIPPIRDQRWLADPASQKQLDCLERDHHVAIDRLPSGFSRSDAWKLIAQLAQRKSAGLCSYRMAKRLAGYGIDTRSLAADRAMQLRNMLHAGGWRPSAIANEPEVRAGRRGQGDLQCLA